MYIVLHKICFSGDMDKEWIRFYEYKFSMTENMVYFRFVSSEYYTYE
jgi:hypothetical protein